MSRKILSFAGVFFLGVVAAALAQEAEPVPAAGPSDAECSGFITGTPWPPDVFVLGGVDNDFHSPVRLFVSGEHVFLHVPAGAQLSVGTEYAIVRPAKYVFRNSWYDGQAYDIRSRGVPYEDVGRVKVTHLTGQGTIAQVTFACEPIYPGDLVIPFQARMVPQYTPGRAFDRFAPPNGKLWGTIIGARSNPAFLGVRSTAYINVGEANFGVKVGQRFRIYHVTYGSLGGLLKYPDAPRESIGELVVLSTHEKSSVGIIIKCTREIAVGDGVELE